MSTKYVHFFGEGKAEGTGTMKDLLGGKGAGLAEMTNAGVPVPPGFTITTEACNQYYARGGKLPRRSRNSRSKLCAGWSGRRDASWAMSGTRCWSRCVPERSSPCPE